MTASVERPAFQFTLRQLLTVVTLTSVFLSLTCWAFRQGISPGLTVTACLLSLAAFALGIRTHHKALCMLGGVGFAVSLLVLSAEVSVLLFIDVGTVVLLVGTVAMNFPPALRNLIHRNCYRRDGGFSKYRADRETAHLLRFGCKLFPLPILVLLLANLAVFVVHTTVMLPLLSTPTAGMSCQPASVWLTVTAAEVFNAPAVVGAPPAANCCASTS